MTSSVMATQVLMIVTNNFTCVICVICKTCKIISNNHQKVCGHYLACPYKYLKHVKLFYMFVMTSSVMATQVLMIVTNNFTCFTYL
jgi:hypothetical protein